MYLIYFDENKSSITEPYFYIGGILIDHVIIRQCDELLMRLQYDSFETNLLSKETEFHGKDIFHGKGNFKKQSLSDRIQILKHIENFVIANDISIRSARVNVPRYHAQHLDLISEYSIGLMLFLERVCDFLDAKDQYGLIFGDFEKDEINKSVHNFSQFKLKGRTSFSNGRSLERLIDTIYFTQSHHSRFLQIADIIIFLANRYEDKEESILGTWHERQCWGIWSRLKQNTDFAIQKWP